MVVELALVFCGLTVPAVRLGHLGKTAKDGIDELAIDLVGFVAYRQILSAIQLGLQSFDKDLQSSA